MNVLTYARVSTQEQADRELSLPAQQQAMRDYAKRQGWIIVGEFVERGVSARTTERPVLRELLARCKQEPKADVVLVHKIDRLARNVYDHASIRMLLKQASIKLASVVENVDDTVSGQLVENIMASIAQFYSANLAEEVKKGMRMLVTKGGWPHKPPRGYQIVRTGDRSQVVLDEATAPVIQQAFERYATGLCSICGVRDDLAHGGVKGATGRPLCSENVRRMLKNPFYAGRVRWKNAEYPGNHPALVSEATFLKVQEVLHLRKHDYGEHARLHFWLRSVARCEQCGRKLTAERHDRWVYYRCIANTINNRLCTAPYINATVAEPAVMALLRRLRLPAALKDQLRRAAQEVVNDKTQTSRFEIGSLRSRRAKLEAQEIRLTETFAQGDLSLNAYRATVDKLHTQLVTINKALQETQHDPTRLLKKLDRLLGVAESLLNLHAVCKPRVQTQFLRVVFKQIVVNRGGLVSYQLNSPFDGLLVESTDEGDGQSPSGSMPDLEETRVSSTIRDILEFDETPLRQILELPTHDNAA